MSTKQLLELSLGPLAQIPPGEGRVFRIGGMTVAVFLDRDGSVHATQPDCPHLGGPLADGLIGGGKLVCPLHERAFDLKTGESAFAGCRIRVYPARVDDAGDIRVTIDA